MEWTRSETLALASIKCTTCHGLGLRLGKRGKMSPCNCVFRAIFRICFNRFRQCVEKEKHLTKCTWDFSGGKDRRTCWGRKDEEYIADFLLMVRRELSAQEYDIFRFRYLLGADWKLCTMKTKMDRGEYFHHVYRVEQILGRAFRETQPYGLFPLDEYFHGTTEPAKPLTPPPAGPKPLRPPLRQPAQSLEPVPQAA